MIFKLYIQNQYFHDIFLYGILNLCQIYFNYLILFTGSLDYCYQLKYNYYFNFIGNFVLQDWNRNLEDQFMKYFEPNLRSFISKNVGI